MTPELPQERHGIVANVVFPTGIDRRDDLGTPDRFDVYYGMADNRIGVARLTFRRLQLPPGERRPDAIVRDATQEAGMKRPSKRSHESSASVVSVRGSVVDIRFDEHLPPIYSLLRRAMTSKSPSKCWRSSMRITCAGSR